VNHMGIAQELSRGFVDMRSPASAELAHKWLDIKGKAIVRAWVEQGA
jgi:hypothetical protein